MSTIIADTDAERTRQGRRPDQVKKHAERGTETYGEGDVETARTKRGGGGAGDGGWGC